LVVLTAGRVLDFVAGGGPFWGPFAGARGGIAGVLPPAEAPPPGAQQAVGRFAARLGGAFGRFCGAHAALGASGAGPPGPLRARRGSGGGGGTGAAGGPAVSIPLPDGRRLVARLPPRQRPSALVLAAFLGAIALVVALGARPVVRRLTGRLERLQRGVESL